MNLAACDGQWCPARDLCKRAAIYDTSTSSEQSYFMVPRDEQVRGVGCRYYEAGPDDLMSYRVSTREVRK